jgi:hypothetical protein
MENAAHAPHLIYLFLLELYKMVLNIIKNKNNKNMKGRANYLHGLWGGRTTFSHPLMAGGVIRPILHNFFFLSIIF